jgi:hypothetical protein
MTTEQITAINNALSMLSDVYQCATSTNSVEEFIEYTDRHIKALKDAGVDNNIVEHCKCLVDAYIPLAHASEVECRKWDDFDSSIIY